MTIRNQFHVAITSIAMLVAAVLLPNTLMAQDEKDTSFPAISSFTEGMKKYDGFFNFYLNEDTAELWLEVENWEKEFLYVTSLPRGLGSNDIGLDRGRLSRTRIVSFRRMGRKAMLVHPNYSYRADSGSNTEKRSVEHSFAESVIWAMTIVAQEGDKALVNANSFLLHDANNVIGVLQRNGQGKYDRDRDRCVIYQPNTRSFPQNTEFEVLMTYQGTPEGWNVRSVTPTPEAITVHQRHSFIQLPDDKYKPRKFDPRSAYHGIDYMDYSVPIDQPMVKRFISRHRLQKKDPNAAISEPIEPIIYYVDSGVPEPVRSALVEGAGWWSEAFEAAGFKNAFQVKVLPADADPMDVRYNVINWVHRSTRGWSYGSSVSDPRTGEIIKGHVSLGSLRVRQDYLIAVALTSPYEDGENAPPELKEMALARIRQLSAHEVGHTLGFVHNYSSSINDRASVMDYPHPLITLDAEGKIDFSQAYDTGIGEWDKVAIEFGYRQFPEGTDQEVALNKILSDAKKAGLSYITDQDARPTGGAHPDAHLWDNGVDAAAELERVMDIRRAALDNFSINVLRNGEPFSRLEEILVPLYMFHRYQAEAAVKLIGGMYYEYSLRGENEVENKIVSAEQQKRALDSLMRTLDPAELVIPQRILKLISPPAPYYGRSQESFEGKTGVVFDPVSPAEAAAGVSLSLLLHPQRANRLVQFHAIDEALPGLGSTVELLYNRTWKSTSSEGLAGEISHATDWIVLRRLMSLAVDSRSSDRVRDIVMLKIWQLNEWLKEEFTKEQDNGRRAHFLNASIAIDNFMKDPGAYPIPPVPEAPPGSPIGSDCRHFVYH